MTTNNFFNLPAELRNEIYALVFGAQQDPPRYPWEDFHKRNPLSLLLTCRQMHAEASSLFWHEHAANTVIHFSSTSQLETFLNEYPIRWPQFSSARFRLQIPVIDNSDSTTAVEELISVQKLLQLLPQNWYSSSIKDWDVENGRRLWDHLFNSAQHRSAVEYIYRAGETGTECVTLRSSHPVLREGIQISCFTWSVEAECGGEVTPSQMLFETDRDRPTSESDRRRKVTGERMIVEGLIQAPTAGFGKMS